MEADEEERKLCAEILDKWNNPSPISSVMLRQNPFSRFDVEEMYDQVMKREDSMEVLPMLVADTFYDKLLGHATDGIDISVLLNNAPVSSCFNLSSRCNNIPTKTAQFSLCNHHDFVRKLGVMLHSNKTPINVDGFGEKTWRNPGVDTTDFFNYGLDEKQWTNYCKQMQALMHDHSQQPTKTNTDITEDGEIVEDDSIYENEIRRRQTPYRRK